MESQQPVLWGILFSTFIPATISLFFRLLGRWLTKSKFWWDDWSAIACYLTAVIWLIILPIWINKGLGLHVADIKEQAVEQIMFDSKLCLYVSEFIYAFALFFAKVSMLCLYWRLFKVADVALPIQILLVYSVIWIILRTFIGIFHCIPVQYFWDTSIEGGYCAIDDRMFFIGSISAHVVTDIAVLLLPIFQVQKLNLPMIQRLGVILMFMFGIFTTAVGVIIIIISLKMDPNSPDYTWAITPFIVWGTVEVNLVNISANLPTIKPAFYYLFKGGIPERQSHGSDTDTYYLTQSKKGIMMTNMRNNHPDESSSTYQLANSMHGSSNGDFEKHAIDGPEGVTTTIESQGAKKDGVLEYSDNENTDGIRVRNETVIQVSESKEARDGSPFSAADDDFV